jgi:hypothetical protein
LTTKGTKGTKGTKKSRNKWIPALLGVLGALVVNFLRRGAPESLPQHNASLPASRLTRPTRAP